MTDYLKTPEKVKEDREEFQRYQRFTARILFMFQAFPDILADRVTWEKCMAAEDWVEASQIAGEAALTWEQRRDRSLWEIELQGCSEWIDGRRLDTELVQFGTEIQVFKSNDPDAIILRFTEKDEGSYRLFGKSWYESCVSKEVLWSGNHLKNPFLRVLYLILMLRNLNLKLCFKAESGNEQIREDPRTGVMGQMGTGFA
jgi:hypothetical protein